VDILWKTAWETLPSAMLVRIGGSIAVEFAGQVWREMIPSLPPTDAERAVPGLRFSPLPGSEQTSRGRQLLAALQWSGIVLGLNQVPGVAVAALFASPSSSSTPR
jgi:hypothetical protein